MRVAICLPRKMHFGPARATAIDLCVRDTVAHSRFRDNTIVFGEPVDEPFADIDYRAMPRSAATSQRAYASALGDAMAAVSPDIIVIHQHLPSASAIRAKVRDVPVLLYRHNSLTIPKSAIKRWLKGRQLAAFDGIVLVSDFIRDQLVAAYPKLGRKAWRVHNGLDFDAWHPGEIRENTILFVGRAVAEKGGLEAARALAEVLAERPGWTARFILSRLDADAAYFHHIEDVLKPLGARATIETDRRHEDVKAAFESAALALVPSIFEEPFGRTAIEAYAGGAALITSGRGGLGEIAQGAAKIVDPQSPSALAGAIRALIDAPERRATLSRQGRERGRAEFDITGLAHKLDHLYASNI
ncbi:glycosyltransferase involved in cell wall biosynthesis [Breoghania corrubedonensis]|uniref:Glycosyltransferase involved in cell wall biosynthesis n=1 Tax=Breoghania corrubedonensis TaxID=665038 RepID=A0A2T5V9J3_9HYPH|nr:glycosyltransferase family 4 protein [Breoghania corrubedonensis]PTW60423.1 glycosyltransferase involved in cell wall biosynthesis [Breoghania corrubedonensis]